MSRLILIALATLTVSLAGTGDPGELTRVRESVWRAWFTNDAKLPEKLVPKDTIVIRSGEEN